MPQKSINTTITAGNTVDAITKEVTVKTEPHAADPLLIEVANNRPQEVPLDSTPDKPNSSATSPTSNLDLEIVDNSNSSSNSMQEMKGMDMMGMMSMMGGMMGNMGNMSNMNNNTTTNGMDTVNRQLLIQLLSTNAAVVQMLAALSGQANNNENLTYQLQPIYQMLASQSSLIQMLYSNLNVKP
jgi:hypothetical protein